MSAIHTSLSSSTGIKKTLVETRLHADRHHSTVPLLRLDLRFMYGKLDQAICVASRHNFIRPSKQICFESCSPAFSAERRGAILGSHFAAAVLAQFLLAFHTEVFSFVQQSLHAAKSDTLLVRWQACRDLRRSLEPQPVTRPSQSLLPDAMRRCFSRLGKIAVPDCHNACNYWPMDKIASWLGKMPGTMKELAG